jgi:hypothetical protein
VAGAGGRESSGFERVDAVAGATSSSLLISGRKWSRVGSHQLRSPRSFMVAMPGNEDEAVALVDAYLERANTVERLAHFER